MTDIDAPFILASDDPTKARFVGDIAARYFLESWQGSGRKPSHCRVRNIGPDSATFVATLGAERGATVAIGVPEIGVLRGRIGRMIGALCMVELQMCNASRQELMGRLNWMVRRKAYGLRERRTMGRFTLQDPTSAASINDGDLYPCTVINASRTGVLVESDLIARIGDKCQVGWLPGKVTRSTENGFAMQFDQQVDDSSLVADLLSIDLPRGESAKVFML